MFYKNRFSASAGADDDSSLIRLDSKRNTVKYEILTEPLGQIPAHNDTVIRSNVRPGQTLIFFLFFGLMCLKQQRLPPRGIRLPFTVILMKGPQARMGAMLVIAVSLLLILRELAIMFSAGNSE